MSCLMRPPRTVARLLGIALVPLTLAAAEIDRGTAPAPAPAEASPGESAERWFDSGARIAGKRLEDGTQARSIVLFIGDGMGLSTVTAARILAGQQAGGSGEEHRLAFDRLEHTALAKTYTTDFQTPDSAGTITAMLSGAKTRSGVIGVGQGVTRGDCGTARDAGLPSLFEYAEAAGLATGVVTSTRVTHATPAAAWAHSPERNWEGDTDLPGSAVAAGCHDIARQLLDFAIGDGIEVVLGGGRQAFMPADQADPEYPDRKGGRADGDDLVQRWRQRAEDAAYVWNARQLEAIDPLESGPVLGLFEPGHMQFEHDRADDSGGEPSLAEMTRFALRKLSTAGRGYVLLVEGGRIDHAHHAGNAYRALTDTIALSEAVEAALQMTSADDTLIVVTADHSHTLTLSGYPPRGHSILGTVGARPGPLPEEPALGERPQTILGYANGPGYVGASDQQPAGPKRFPHQPRSFEPASGRPDLRRHDTTHPDYLQEAAVPRSSETHAGEDVPVYARGPGADAIRGVIEQNVLFHVMAQAQPAIRQRLCDGGACEDGLPVRLPRSP